MLHVALGVGVATSLPFNALAESMALVSSEKDNAISMVSIKDLTVQGTIATCKPCRTLRLGATAIGPIVRVRSRTDG